jgi:hypothetical protein
MSDPSRVLQFGNLDSMLLSTSTINSYLMNEITALIVQLTSLDPKPDEGDRCP